MTVYVLYKTCWEETVIEGVFSSREKADAHITKETNADPALNDWEIEECVIDAAEAKEWRPCHVVWLYTDGATKRLGYTDLFPGKMAGEIEVQPGMKDEFLPPTEGLCRNDYRGIIKAYSPVSAEHAACLAREEYARYMEWKAADDQRRAEAGQWVKDEAARRFVPIVRP